MDNWLADWYALAHFLGLSTGGGAPYDKIKKAVKVTMKLNSLLPVFLVVLIFAGTVHAYTREEVVERGSLRCGVSTGSPGFSTIDGAGRWTGFDVDICRAVAAATLGDADKVEFLPLVEGESFTALLAGEVDILARHSTWTFTRESALGVHFAAIGYYDGQGILVYKKLNVSRLADLKKVKVCSPVESSYEGNLVDYFKRNNVDYKIVAYENTDLAVEGFKKEACNMISMPQSQLYGLQQALAEPDSVVVLPEIIAKEPLGPVVRQDDDNWLNIVRWSFYAMVTGEELGVTSMNIDEMRMNSSLAVKRLFGSEGTGGKGLGLKDDWAIQILRQVGNYGEIFEKNLGPASALNIDRGMNNLWTRGGLQYAPPLQ